MSSMTGSRGPAGSSIPKGYKVGQIQQFTPEQMDLFKRSFSQVAPDSQLSKLASGDEGAFKPFEDRAKRDFQEFSGQNASRFSQLAPGAMSARRGSGFQNAQTQGTVDFASNLAEKRYGLQRQAMMDMNKMIQDLLGQNPYQNFLVVKQQKNKGYGGLIGAGIGGLGGLFAGGPGGAITGAQLGYNVGSSF